MAEAIDNVVDSRTCALIAARAADAKKATDIMVQEVRDLIGVTDYFVIITAANNRQVDAIVDAVEEALRKQAAIKPLHREETPDGTWSLLDYGALIVHVFQPKRDLRISNIPIALRDFSKALHIEVKTKEMPNKAT